MHGEEQSEEQEQERAKNFPAEASASSSGFSASGYNVDVPMTGDVARGRLRDRDDEQQDPPRRKRYKQVGKLTVDEDPADYLGNACELDWSEERLLEIDRVETEKAEVEENGSAQFASLGESTSGRSFARTCMHQGESLHEQDH